MNVNRLPQVVQTHGRTLDVPARPPSPKRALPGRFARLGPLPQRKVPRMFLARILLDARARQCFLQPTPAQFAVVLVASDPKIHIPIQPVGVALLLQPQNHRRDPRHLLAHARVKVSRQDVELAQMAQVLAGVMVGQFQRVTPLFARTANDLVVDICEVGHKVNRIALVDQIATYGVEDDGSHRMADMGVGIDGRAADVHGDLARLMGHERLCLSGKRVVDTKRHKTFPIWIGSAVGGLLAPARLVQG